MAPFITRRRVQFRDTDAAGIVHFSAFLLWMESAEHDLLRAAGLKVIDRGSDGVDVSWPRVSVSCDFKAAVRFDEEVDIAVTVERIGRSSVTYAFAFSHDGRPVAEGRVVAVRCLLQPGRDPASVAIADDIVARLSAFRPQA